MRAIYRLLTYNLFNRGLKKAFDYAKKRKEASKKKTIRMRKKKK